jgi:hypothetical protein
VESSHSSGDAEGLQPLRGRRRKVTPGLCGVWVRPGRSQVRFATVKRGRGEQRQRLVWGMLRKCSFEYMIGNNYKYS